MRGYFRRGRDGRFRFTGFSAGLAGLAALGFGRLVWVLVVLFWPLGIFARAGHATIPGIVLEVVWLVLAASAWYGRRRAR